MKKQIQGIAFILFGILLCCAEQGINHILLASFNDFPFSLFGILSGCVGLNFVFQKDKNE